MRALPLITFSDFPNPHALVSAASGEEISAPRPGGALHFVLVTFQLRDAFPTGGEILPSSSSSSPHAGGGVEGRGGQVFAAGRPSYLTNRPLMTVSQNRLANPFLDRRRRSWSGISKAKDC